MRQNKKDIEIGDEIDFSIPEVSDSLLDSSFHADDDIEKTITADNAILKKIPPAKWDALITILDFLTKESDDSVIIDKSIIFYSYRGGSIIRVDLTEIFDGQEINLHISSPKKWTRLFKALKNNNIYILDDENKFIVTDGQIKLFLPKQLNSVIHNLSMPDFTKSETICSSTIQKDTRDKVLKLGKDVEFLEFLIKDKKLTSFNIPNTAILILPEFVKDETSQSLTNKNADLVLRAQTFLPYNSDIYKLIVGKNLLNDSYFSYTTCNSQMIKIEIYEPLDNSSGIESLF